MTLILAAAAITAGLILLVWSADRFVEGAASIACYGHVSPFLIGVLVIGFGTSAPELAVSLLAALENQPSLAVGNAYGSNIANIALILGITALLTPFSTSAPFRREFLFLGLATALAGFQLWDAEISRLEGAALLAAFLGLIAWKISQSRNHPHPQNPDVYKLPIGKTVLYTLIGLGLLIGSSRLLVWGAVAAARQLGLSDLIIGLTIVAAGTSLPELASSLAAARKGQSDMALGNIIGSNLFNTLPVVGLAAAVTPIRTEPEVLSRDLPVTAALTLGLFLMVGNPFQKTHRLNRFEAAVLLLCYTGYIGFLVMSTS